MEAVVLFGSQVSGGSDIRSDQDLLVVCDINKKKSKIKKYTDLGYSVSIYSDKQLFLMKEHGSLFLQHLKLESLILQDENNLFKKFISTCIITHPSDKELKSCVNSIINSLQCPISSELSWWHADYLYVLSRDYFIKYFAKTDRLIFNINKLSKAIKGEFNLSQSEVDTLLKLRKAKSLYRSNNKTPQSMTRIVNDWSATLSKMLKFTIPNRYDVDFYIYYRKINSFESPYELLRYVESLKIAAPSIHCETEKEIIINKLITKPNNYSSTSVRGKDFLISYLQEFRQKANKSLNSTTKSAVSLRSTMLLVAS